MNPIKYRIEKCNISQTPKMSKPYWFVDIVENGSFKNLASFKTESEANQYLQQYIKQTKQTL